MSVAAVTELRGVFRRLPCRGGLGARLGQFGTKSLPILL